MIRILMEMLQQTEKGGKYTKIAKGSNKLPLTIKDGLKKLKMELW
jgi:hypothetical protein